MKRIRIATRRSALALWQAEHVAGLLRAAHPGLGIEIVPMSTRGDELLDTSLAALGGKGLFTQELERAMLDGRADIAVHSMKDVPARLPEGFRIGAVVARDDPFDALVCNGHGSLEALPRGARVGTSSLRRAFQLKHARRDLVIDPLRGNVTTRLQKLDAGRYEAVILAVAGLERLGLEARITTRLDAALCLPAIGQGAIGVESHDGDDATLERVRAIEHHASRLCVDAERAVNRALEGSCESPIAAHARLDGDRIRVTARVGLPDGSEMLESVAEGSADEAATVGARAGQDLLEQGAAGLLARAGGPG